MRIKGLFIKRFSSLKMRIIYWFFQYPRIIKYRFLSDCKQVQGKPKFNQPAIISGAGKILFGNNVQIGVKKSPFYYSGYCYIEARNESSKIRFGDNVIINNCCSFISGGEGIDIGKDTVIGSNCEFIDSDFHELNPSKRNEGTPKTARIVVGKNVFIGSNVKFLKGVTVGNNSVIANCSVVAKTVPENVVAGGNPAKVLRAL